MINWPRVIQLREEVGAEEFDEVVQIFLEEVQEILTSLQKDADQGKLAQSLHFLKGSALSLGFDSFSKLCQTGERHAAAGQEGKVDVPEILGAFQIAKSAFEAGLADHL